MFLPEIYPGPTINPMSAAHRAAQDLVVFKKILRIMVLDILKNVLHLVWVL